MNSPAPRARPRIARIPRAARKHSPVCLQSKRHSRTRLSLVHAGPCDFVVIGFQWRPHYRRDGASPPPKHQAREGNAQRERFFLSERDIRIGGRVSPLGQRVPAHPFGEARLPGDTVRAHSPNREITKERRARANARYQTQISAKSRTRVQVHNTGRKTQTP